MKELAMAGGRFEVALRSLLPGRQRCGQRGSRIPGRDQSRASSRAPLAKVASGGELSRISLAIQVITSKAARCRP